MSFSNWWEHKILSAMFKDAPFWLPFMVVELSRSPLTERGGLDPPLHPSYEPAQTEPGTWLLAAPGVLYNDTTISFPMAGGDWGTLTHVALCDPSYYNMVLAYGDLEHNLHVTEGMRPILRWKGLRVELL